MHTKILVVVDTQPDFDRIAQALEGQGWKVLTAKSGLAALGLARIHLPDLIILDWVLPDLDGLSIADILHRQPSTKEIPLIILTAMADEFQMDPVRLDGVAIFLNKPIAVGTLAANVRQLLAWQSARLEALNQPLAPGW